MKQSTIIHDVTPDEIANLFHGLQQQLTDLKMNLEPKKPIELLTRNEVAELLKVDLSTIHNWCKQNRLIPFGIGNRIYFKRSDIESTLVNLGKKRGGIDV
jgi:hypothetical protein